MRRGQGKKHPGKGNNTPGSTSKNKPSGRISTTSSPRDRGSSRAPNLASITETA